jgi:hypothetical protein
MVILPLEQFPVRILLLVGGAGGGRFENLLIKASTE